MKLSETTYDNSETGCCAPLDVARWDEQEVTWNKKPFLRDHIREFLHLPLNFGSVITRDNNAIEEAAAYPREPLWLVDEVSPWGSDIYVAVEGEVPGATIDKLSGRFLTKVFEGPYRHVGKWTRKMTEYAESQGELVSKIYYYYATCPKCAKHFGANHVVLFAQLA
jgi:hypothetical protein